MKSVRLDASLEAALTCAARAQAMSQSEFIRDALLRRCQEVLGDSLATRLAPVVGVVKSSGGRAGKSGLSFRKTLAKRKKKK